MSKDWMSVRIPSELAEEIRAEAKATHQTITKVVEGRLSVKVVDVTDPEPTVVGLVEAEPVAAAWAGSYPDVQGTDGQATTGSLNLGVGDKSETEPPPVQEPASVPCTHPEDRQKKLSNSAAFCLDCRHVYKI